MGTVRVPARMQQGADCFLPGLDAVAGACDFFGPIQVEIIIGFMVTEVEATFEVSFSDDDIVEINTVGDLRQKLRRLGVEI